MNGNIKLGPNWLRVENRKLFGKGLSSVKRRFARRVFALPEVESLTIDPATGAALIRYHAEEDGAGPVGRRLADAVGGSCIELDDNALPVWPTDERTVLRRWNDVISCLHVVQKNPYEIELRHPGFAGNGKMLGRRIKERLASEHGVARASLSLLKGNVRLRLTPGADPEDLVRRTEKMLPAARFQHPLPAYRPVKFGAANFNMGLCTAGQFMFPAMIPLASGVLLATRLGTFRDAGKQLMRGKLGVPTFQSIVVACSVASGAPIASALGEWLGCFWQRRWRRKVAAETRILLNEAFPPAQQAVTVDANGVERNVPVAALNPGDRVIVRATELVPVDGRVLSGEALIDETRLRGVLGAVRKRPRDRVSGSCPVLAGTLVVEVEATHTEAAQLARDIADRTAAMPEDRGLRLKAAAAAERSVLPNLAIAGLGLATGGLHTASAILHQDWITGPYVAFPTQSFRDMRLSIQLGALVNSPTALSRLGAADLLLIDGNTPGLLAPGIELESIETGLEDSAELLQRCASVGLYLGDERAEALAAACRSRGLALRQADAIVLGTGRSQGKVGGLNIALLDEAGGSAGPLAPLTVRIDGEDAARLRFRHSAAPKAAEVLAALKMLGLKIIVVSEEHDGKAEDMSKRLGADLAGGGMGNAETLRFLRKLKQLGHKAGYVGAAGISAEIAAEAQVTIGLGGFTACETPADINLLGDTLAALPQLLQLGKHQEAKVGTACRQAIIPNLLCIAGAFTGVLSGTTSTLLANVGVMNVDRRQRRLLDGKLAPA